MPLATPLGRAYWDFTWQKKEWARPLLDIVRWDRTRDTGGRLGRQAFAGAIRAIGAGMATRMRAMPDLSTVQEQGLKSFECYTWNAIVAPRGTPQPVVDRLNAAINKALADPAVVNRLQELGIDPTPGGTPQQADAFIRGELAKWSPIIGAAGAQMD